MNLPDPRNSEKLRRLERMRLLLGGLPGLSDELLAELEDLVAPHPYPGINIALDFEREAVAAERGRRTK